MSRLKRAGAAEAAYGLRIEKNLPQDKVIALAGNPNVGKSTVFNNLTGLRQHTGNWPGKTVVNAQGSYEYRGKNYLLVDLPGTYSLMANSAEEEAARDFLCFGQPDIAVVVADATCLERNLNLLLQVMEIMPKTILCLNLMDEAAKKGIDIDIPRLSAHLGIPVIPTSARNGRGLEDLMAQIQESTAETGENPALNPLRLQYEAEIEAAAALLEPVLEQKLQGRLNSRWLALRLLDGGDDSLAAALQTYLGYDICRDEAVASALNQAHNLFKEYGIPQNLVRDRIVTKIVESCEAICRDAVKLENQHYQERDRRLDKILTAKSTGIPIMLLLLFGVFWITLSGANYPSALLAAGLFALIEPLHAFFAWLSAPAWLSSLLVEGVYKTLAWVISVMLPPMAIFFPLFTLLEDSGYLPRIAFNLDHFFRRACAHGKQALTMCMGFGCNAAGIIGCRIIDSPRERLIAIITNNFVPCNGRFPTLIALIAMFFIGTEGGLGASLLSALLLTAVIVLGILMTLLISKLLSKTILKGLPSSFQLELPPYRRPQIGQVIIRSLLDRTLFVLGRAILVAAPAGLIIWILANLHWQNLSLLAHIAAFLDPFAWLMGLDGFILLAFILGLPANEVVIPILIMSYMASGTLTDFQSLAQLRALFIEHNWTWLTALCTMLFALMHWPCGTTLLTIKKETQSLKWTLVSLAVPTLCGILICMAIAGAVRLLGLV